VICKGKNVSVDNEKRVIFRSQTEFFSMSCCTHIYYCIHYNLILHAGHATFLA
jgi:hypothetical protein